jgi:hypothetical protein
MIYRLFYVQLFENNTNHINQHENWKVTCFIK